MPWLEFGMGVETSDHIRTQWLLNQYFGRVDDLAHDDELRQRYQRAGIDAVFLSWSILDPAVEPRRVYRRKESPSDWGDDDSQNGLYVEASFPDRPELTKDELDEYLGREARRVMESWRRLKA